MKHLFTLLSLLLLLPVAAWGQEPVKYQKWNGTEVADADPITTYIEINESQKPTSWGENDDQEHWYVVNEDVTIGETDNPQRVTVNGDVHLILADGCSLTVNGGINVAEGNSLTIYAQSTDEETMGKLVATGSDSAAGIGGGYGETGGEITIHGGNVTAKGGEYGAGIGGGCEGDGGTITIHGGNVTATGGTRGAGIGGGEYGSGGTITISGGKVTAESIVGTTTGVGAGIGKGSGSTDAGSIKPSPGTFSTGKNGNAFIIAKSGSVKSAISDDEDKSEWSGVIFLCDNGGVYGNQELKEDLTIKTNQTLTIVEDATLTIPQSVTLTNEGTIINYGTIDGTGTMPDNILTGLTEDMIKVAEATYTGNAVTPDVTVSKGGTTFLIDTDYDVTYSDNNIDACDATAENAPTVTVTPSSDDKLVGDPVSVKFTIEKADATIGKISVDDKDYDGNKVAITAPAVTGAGLTGVTATLSYYKVDNEQETSLEEAPADAGTYKVKASYAGDDNHNAATDVTATFTITQATATLLFAEETVSATIGETVENTLTVTLAGVTVSYSSSNKEVATVDASTGAITLVGAGETTITATINNPNYKGEAASYTLTVTKATLDEDKIAAEGETSISIEMDGTSFELTAKVTVDEPGTGGTWVWTSSDINVATVSEKGDAASGYSLRATTDPKTSTAIVTPVAVGTTTITATYDDGKYHGSVTYTVTVTEPYVPEPPSDPISYYNIYVEDVCDGVEVTLSNNVVREGNSISVYVEKDTANYTFDNFQVYYKRSYYGPWEVLEEGTQPGEYPIRNIWTHIYVKAEGAEEKEDPTGIEEITGVKVYTKDGSLYVQTPQREQVLVITMTGVVVKNEEQVGLKQYHGLQPGIYVVRIGEKAYKVRLN